MRQYTAASLTLAAFMTFSTVPSAAEPSKWSTALDNDFFAATGKDRDYTAGLNITRWTDDGRALQAGVQIYSPQALDASAPAGADRPYANLLFAASTREWEERGALYQRTLTFGVLGSRLGAQLHRQTHAALNSTPVAAFDNQLSDGGEVTAGLQWSRYQPLNTAIAPINIVAETHWSAGYRTEASIGLGFRFNRGQGRWREATRDFRPHPEAPAKRFSGSGWHAGVRLRVVAYNALLQGQFRNTDFAVDAADVSRLSIESWVGFDTRLGNWHLGYTLRGRSAELRGNAANGYQVYGELTLRRIHQR